MNCHDFSIGSFLDATENDFYDLYQHNSELHAHPEIEIVNECVFKKEIALYDAEFLKKYKITPKLIGEKVSEIIKNSLHKQSIDQRSDWLNYMEKMENEAYLVSKYEKQTFNQCYFCSQTFSSTKYRIKNNKKLYSFEVKDLNLHYIINHDYFSKPGKYRLSPSKIVKVLDLGDL